MKHLEIRDIEHKGISITIRIDYNGGTGSIVTKKPHNAMGIVFEPKEFVFAGRTLDYMQGWINIMEAMLFATLEIKKALEQDLAEKSKFKDKMVLEGAKAVRKSRK